MSLQLRMEIYQVWKRGLFIFSLYAFLIHNVNLLYVLKNNYKWMATN